MSWFSYFLFVPFLLSAASHQFHEAPYQAGYDIDFSPYAGGEDLLFAHRAVERIEGFFVAKTSLYRSTTASARFWRFSELYLGWLPLNYLAIVVQHEVFGHGYRIRDIGSTKAQVQGYDFETPPPYGWGGAVTHYKISSSFTSTDETCVAMAGVESTAILAQLTKLKWLQAGRIDPRQTVLYLLGQHDLNLYIGSLEVSNDEELDGHDIHAYIQSLNTTYTDHSLSKGRLQSLSWINLGDPFSFYSIYAWFRYIASGKETRIPMIPIYGMGYLPGVRLGLTPFGPELFIENYLSKHKEPIYFYLKGGSHSDNRYGGMGVYVPQMWNQNGWSLGFRFDAWRQPKLLLKSGPYSYAEQHAMRFGGAGSFIIAYQKRSGFEAEVGYKSQGFLPGYALRASPTLRLFYSLRF